MDTYTATEQSFKNGYSKGKPKWISVAERLPEVNQRILVFYKEDGVNMGCFAGGHSFRVRLWKDQMLPDLVTHWMPLPDPPKNKEENL